MFNKANFALYSGTDIPNGNGIYILILTFGHISARTWRTKNGHVKQINISNKSAFSPPGSHTDIMLEQSFLTNMVFNM